MHTDPKQTKVFKSHLDQLEVLLKAQGYQTWKRYDNGELKFEISRGNEYHWIKFLVDPNHSSTHYIHISNDIKSAFVTNATNKHLGLDLTVNYKESTQSVFIEKPVMKAFIKELMSLGYQLRWSYPQDACALHITSETGEENILTFARDTKIFKLQKSDIITDQVHYLFKQRTGAKVVKSETPLNKSDKHLKLEIDYHLLELHEYIQANNHDMIDSIKNKLSFLQRQLHTVK